MKNHYRNIGFVIITVAFVISFSTAYASYTFNYSTYNYPGAGNTYVYGLNNSGELVGYYTPLILAW